MNRFVILAAPRSGSNMLCTMLGSHPRILCHHELFNPKGVRLALPLRGSAFTLGSIDERERDPIAFLERAWQANMGFSCVGFKLTHRQNEAVFRRMLEDRSVAKVVLGRRNRLKTYVSYRMSEALGEWEVYRGEELIRQRPRVRVEPRQFFERVAFDEAYYNEIRHALDSPGQESIAVVYEDLFAVDEQNRLLRFLGVEPTARGLKIDSVKQNSSDLRDLIENYEEVSRALAGTPFAAELTEGAPC